MHKFLTFLVLSSISSYFYVAAMENNRLQNIYHNKELGIITASHNSKIITTTVTKEIKSKNWFVNATKNIATGTSCLVKNNSKWPVFVYMSVDNEFAVIPNPNIVEELKRQINEFECNL